MKLQLEMPYRSTPEGLANIEADARSKLVKSNNFRLTYQNLNKIVIVIKRKFYHSYWKALIHLKASFNVFI
jgi:hypothetical protein